MYKVSKVISESVLSEMEDDVLSNIFDTHQSSLAGEDADIYRDERTSKTIMCHRTFYPEFCLELEKFVDDGTKVTQLDVLLYEEGDKFLIHQDVIGKSNDRVWSTSTIIKYSDDYEGKGLALYTDDRKVLKQTEPTYPRQDVGDTIIFRSNVYHEAKPVEKGTRLVAVAWLGYK